jgi:hypothetical protein
MQTQQFEKRGSSSGSKTMVASIAETGIFAAHVVNHGSAVDIGYNSNLCDPTPLLASFNLLRRPDSFINDSKQFFIKFSYLFRF